MGVLEQGRLRANPAYELALLERLAPGERALVAEAEDGDVYGVLRPRPGSALELRTASSETALLFLTLAEPGPLPEYVRARLGAEVDRTIGRLVLDGVLELEQAEGFVSGAAAARFLLPERSDGGRGRIGELSIAALRYGQELGEVDESLLAMRLYLYGRLPISPALRSRWADETAVASYIGVLPGGAARAALEEGWIEGQEGEGRAYWRSWQPRATSAGKPARGGARYKLYVSPGIEALPEAVLAVAAGLRGAPGLSAFKVGRDISGICRPDKLVVYFDRLDDLRRAAEALRERLGGCAAHGVPFSAAIAADGLLSWGSDPPRESTAAGSRSWRLWIAERLAEYLVRGRRSDSDGPPPWRFALERLSLAGVDTDTWAPTSGIWPAAKAGG